MVVPGGAAVGSYCWLSLGRSYAGEPAGFDNGGGALLSPGSFVFWMKSESWSPWSLLLVLLLVVTVGASLAGVMSRGLQALTMERRVAGFDSGGEALLSPGSFVFWMNGESWSPWSLLLVLLLAQDYCWLFFGTFRSYVERATRFDSGGEALLSPGSFVFWMNRES